MGWLDVTEGSPLSRAWVARVRWPVMAVYLCFIALVSVPINLIVDLPYFVVDPRLHVARPVGR
jgi:ABC-type dipeptide/oligopeptide/nickel transport system permease component